MSNLGWECPKCGGVFAPWLGVCTNCTPKPTPTQVPERYFTNPQTYCSHPPPLDQRTDGFYCFVCREKVPTAAPQATPKIING